MKELDLLKQFLSQARDKGIIDSLNAVSGSQFTDADIERDIHILESIESLPESEQKLMYEQIRRSLEDSAREGAARALREIDEMKRKGTSD